DEGAGQPLVEHVAVEDAARAGGPVADLDLRPADGLAAAAVDVEPPREPDVELLAGIGDHAAHVADVDGRRAPSPPRPSESDTMGPPGVGGFVRPHGQSSQPSGIPSPSPSSRSSWPAHWSSASHTVSPSASAHGPSAPPS